MKKEKVIEAVSELPKEFELEVLVEKLLFIEKVEKGLKSLDEGKSKTQQELKEIIKTW